jgi:hypothetical protein
MPGIHTRIKPKSGFSHFVHIFFNALLPALMFVLVRMGFVPIAVGLVLLSKWRMFAVRPRYWPANLRANAVDIIVGLSTVVFMANATEASWQLVWAAAYAGWLILIKPGSSVGKTSLQAMVAQTTGLMAVFLGWSASPLYVLVILAWLVCYSSARHFFTAFEEQYTSLYAHTWGYFAAALTWVLGHWLLFYGFISQPALILSVLGFGMAALYYLEQTERSNQLIKRQFVFIMVAIVVVVLTFSKWGGIAV